MENALSSAEYRERAEMHDCLAGSTADSEARRMHRAMAAEYRRRADEADAASLGVIRSGGGMLEMAVSAGGPA